MPEGFWIAIEEDKETKYYPTHCTNGDATRDVEVSEDHKTVVLRNTARLEFLKTKRDNDWAFFELLDKKIEYDVELGNVKKGSNFAFYTCQLTKGQEYKDAQTSWDSRCEIDLMEANRIAYHFTAHKAWDRGGNLIMGTGGGIQNDPTRRFQSDTGLDITQLYGPGKYIDTNRRFHVAISFRKDAILLELTQGTNRVWQTAGGEYLRTLLPELEGRRHTLVLSLWNSWNMGWLDGGLPWSDESGITQVNATISNISIRTLEAVSSSE